MDHQTSTNANTEEPSSNIASPAVLTEKHKLIQRQLLLLLHATNCTSPNNDVNNNNENTTTGHHPSCTIQHCSTMKQVLAHLANTCHSPEELKSAGAKKCTFPYCFSSRLISTHWAHCNMKKSQAAAVIGVKTETPTNANDVKSPHCCLICGPAIKYLLHVREAKEASLKRSIVAAPDEFRQYETKKRKRANTLESLYRIWSGNLNWYKQPVNSIPPAIQIQHQELLNVQIFSSTKKYRIIETSNLNMKLIPSSILTKLGLDLEHGGGVQPVSFTFKKQESQELKELLKSNHYSGFIYSNSSNSSASESNAIKFLILQSYDEVCNKFLGWIPIQQKTFIEAMKRIVLEVKAKSFNLEVVKRLNQLNCKDDKEEQQEEEMILS